MSGYIYMSIMVILTSVAQVFIKKGSRVVTTKGGFKVIILSLFNVPLVIGGMLTFFAPVFYILALKELDLSTAFFFTSLNIISICLILAMK